MIRHHREQLPTALLLPAIATAVVVVLRIIPEGPGVPWQLTLPHTLLTALRAAYYALPALLIVGCTAVGIRERRTHTVRLTWAAVPCGVLLLTACISLISNHVPSVFRAWPRLAAFTMVLLLCGPIVVTDVADNLRRSLLRYICAGCIFISLLYATALCFYLTHYTSYLSRYHYVWDWLNVASVPCGAAASIAALWAWTRLCNPLSVMAQRAWWGVLALCWWTTIMASSRAAIAGLAAAMTAGLLLSGRTMHTRLRWVSIAMIAFMAVATLLPLTEIMETKHWKIADTPTDNYFSSRQDIWEARTQEIDNHWLIGIGFASVKSNPGALNPEGTVPSDGRIEPGSGWLHLLSSCGVFALAAFGVVYAWGVVGATRNLLSSNTYAMSDALLSLGLMLMFGVHLCTEGYVTAAGSPFCMLLWLTLGVGCTSLKPTLRHG